MVSQDIQRRSGGPVLGVSVCVIRAACVLLSQRAKPPFQDKWSLPGGHVETGERLEEAAMRELSEETGLEPVLQGIFDWTEIIDSKRHYVIAVFRAKWKAGEPRAGGDAKAVRWAKVEELDQLELTPGLGKVVRKALGR
jgi:mutator protein MutT